MQNHELTKMNHKSKAKSKSKAWCKFVHSERKKQQQTLQEMENIDPVHQEHRHYTATYRSIAPLNSGVVDNPAAAVEIGTLVSVDHVNAAIFQYNTRKVLFKQGSATANEVLEAKVRKDSLAYETWRPIPLPYGDARMEQLIAALSQNIIGAMDRRFNAMDRRLDGIQITLNGVAIQTARNTNRLYSAGSTFTPVPNNRGEVPRPGLFPETYETFATMEIQGVDELLAFYDIMLPARGRGRGQPYLEEKKRSLSVHCGFSSF